MGTAGMQADAIQDQRIAGEDEEQEQALNDARDLVGNAHGRLYGFPSDVGQGQHEAGDQNTDWIEPSEKGNDNGGEAISRRNRRQKLVERPGYFHGACKARQTAGKRERE